MLYSKAQLKKLHFYLVHIFQIPVKIYFFVQFWRPCICIVVGIKIDPKDHTDLSIIEGHDKVLKNNNLHNNLIRKGRE
jgi:hypothetical protein